MRRLSAMAAKKGMVLGVAVHASWGDLLFEANTTLDDTDVRKLKTANVGEIFINDDRFVDLVVSSIYPPELEGRAAYALKELIEKVKIKKKSMVASLRQWKSPSGG